MSLYTSRVLAACSKGDIAYLHRISKETSLSSCLDKFGASPVHYAVRSGKRDCLQWLVMVGGLSPRTPAHNGAMPVHDAAATGQLECLEWLVRKGGCDADARDCAQATPLHLAARFGHISIVEWLVVEEQCSPMERAQNGATPVHLAAAKGSTNCLKWLTKKEPRYCAVENERWLVRCIRILYAYTVVFIHNRLVYNFVYSNCTFTVKSILYIIIIIV